MRRFMFIGRVGMIGFLLWIGISLFLAQTAGCQEQGTGQVRSPTGVSTGSCGAEEAVETDGIRRLALIVGVGQYVNRSVPDLKGPVNDARRFYSLLTAEGGYRFPKANVCLLLDEQATTANFKRVFQSALVERARENDVAVVYFAGHGSQARDENGDEPDEWDETLMFHDARTGGVSDLLDDDFNRMLAALHRKTRHVTVILDSCNSGTATRDPEASTTLARFVPPVKEERAEGPPVFIAEADEGSGWVTESLPGAVILSAATDSNPALEKKGRGIFTDAVLSVLSDASDQPMTYAQLSRRVPLLVAAESYQVPYFHGDLRRKVFDSRVRAHPFAWEVIRTESGLEIGGPPLPGAGLGAEFRIYDGSVTGESTRDPGKAKATVVVTGMTGLNAEAQISAAKADHPEIRPGDLAVLARPADSFIALKVRLRPSEEPGGIPEERAAKIRDMVENHARSGVAIELAEGPGEFELSLGHEDQLILRGPHNRIRNTYEADEQVPESLGRHARQGALLQLRGNGGDDFTDHQTLKVSLVPAAKQNRCADGTWEQAEPNTHQVVPLCHQWNIQVERTDDTPIPLLVGALILSTDGAILPLPRDGRKVELDRGERVRFDASGETLIGVPPLGIKDRVMVFGTQVTNPVDWGQFAEPAPTRSPGASGLQRALYRYFESGKRGSRFLEEEAVEDTTWTLSLTTFSVAANPGFAAAAQDSDQSIDRREYTIPRFDIRPYLPDDETTALYKVLTLADGLAKASAADGYGYRQHGWNKSTDEENLKYGIDCSRAIWFAFTRSGLTYNRDNRYLSTAMMVSDDTLMQDAFEPCSGGSIQTGDILVYRDDRRGDGHVVMVIDPEKRIAWGSHGWDGTPHVLPVEPDTGVEYQKIKYKKDWERWDRKTMERKACWRHRQFSEERLGSRGLTGSKALKNICNPSKNCGR